MPLYNPVSLVPTSSTVTASSVAAATTSTSLLAANNNRKGATIFNSSTAFLYVELGATATTAAYAIKIDPSGYFELPFGYTGAIAGIWSAANGSALVREFT